MEYGYPEYRGDLEGNSEFEFKILSIMLDRDDNISKKVYQEIEGILKDELDKIISTKYNEVEKSTALKQVF